MGIDSSACEVTTLLTEPPSQMYLIRRCQECRFVGDRVRVLLLELDRMSWLIHSRVHILILVAFEMVHLMKTLGPNDVTK